MCELFTPTRLYSDVSIETCVDGAGNDAAAVSTDFIYTSELLMDIMRGSEYE